MEIDQNYYKQGRHNEECNEAEAEAEVAGAGRQGFQSAVERVVLLECTEAEARAEVVFLELTGLQNYMCDYFS